MAKLEDSSYSSPFSKNFRRPRTKFTPRERLAYDEILANQLALALIRQRRVHLKGRSLTLSNEKLSTALDALPFKLTNGQFVALSEILGDMKSGRRMQRLLQGDVGSGKTVVAFLACLAVIEAGAQATLMAPTDVLARQHGRTLQMLGEKIGIRVAVLTGRDKGKSREATLIALMAGEIDLLIGTHALFQNSVNFKDLALIVVDEQHRFGVDQRMALSAKGLAPHMLAMTATLFHGPLCSQLMGIWTISRSLKNPQAVKP